MKRSCLVYLGFFVGVAILASIALLLTIPPAPPGFSVPFVMKLGWAIGVGLAASGSLTLALFGLRDSLQRLSDRARLGMTRRTTPRDGERTVAFGKVVADGPLLESPFTGTRCVCYSYEVRCTTRGRSSTDVLCAWGYALTPSYIEAPWGTVRLLSYTNIDESPRSWTIPPCGEWPLRILQRRNSSRPDTVRRTWASQPSSNCTRIRMATSRETLVRFPPTSSKETIGFTRKL